MVAVVATSPYGHCVPDLVRALLVLRHLLVGASFVTRTAMYESAATDIRCDMQSEWTGLRAQSTLASHLARCRKIALVARHTPDLPADEVPSAQDPERQGEEQHRVGHLDHHDGL